MEAQVFADGRLSLGGKIFPCVLGRGGVSTAKREGDGATPAGIWPLRELFFRGDRLARPATGLPARQILPDDGWCDASADPAYNRLVKRPYPASHEALWRDDHVYDVIVVVGYNDAPVIPGRGSAIFMHLTGPGRGPTAGCVALDRDDLLTVVARLDPSSRLIIHPAA